MADVFFSYSHRDEDYRNELEIHLSMLKRSKVIGTWHDRRITAGSELDGSISSALDNADVILLLISPYFLDSDYCYEVEMKRAMQRHESGEAIVIPVILHPCDWQESVFGKLMATPTDGKPVSKHTNLHDAFLDITNAIKNSIQQLNKKSDSATGKERNQKPHNISSEYEGASRLDDFPRSSNLRVRKEFSEQDKHDFIDDTFEYISKFFEGSLQELCSRNAELSYRYKRIDSEHFSAAIYRSGQSVSECRIWIGGGRHFMGDIMYSSDSRASDNTCNDSISVETG